MCSFERTLATSAEIFFPMFRFALRTRKRPRKYFTATGMCWYLHRISIPCDKNKNKNTCGHFKSYSWKKKPRKSTKKRFCRKKFNFY